jgi:hypothetical protein
MSNVARDNNLLGNVIILTCIIHGNIASRFPSSVPNMRSRELNMWSAVTAIIAMRKSA